MKRDNITISPSIASANPLCLEQELKKVEAAGCSDLHIDIEDGNFIPNITFGLKTVAALRRATSLPFSFHLMTKHWRPWVDHAAKLGGSVIFAHYETLAYPREFLFAAKKQHLRCGFALNPKTPVEDLGYLVEELDAVLLLTVEPDGAGEAFIPGVLQKIAQAKHLLGAKTELWVDGNVTNERLAELAPLGVTHAVMGRDFFGSPNSVVGQ